MTTVFLIKDDDGFIYRLEREGRHHEVLNNNNDKTRQHNNVYLQSQAVHEKFSLWTA